jgi:hypothetical protein
LPFQNDVGKLPAFSHLSNFQPRRQARSSYRTCLSIKRIPRDTPYKDQDWYTAVPNLYTVFRRCERLLESSTRTEILGQSSQLQTLKAQTDSMIRVLRSATDRADQGTLIRAHRNIIEGYLNCKLTLLLDHPSEKTVNTVKQLMQAWTRADTLIYRWRTQVAHVRVMTSNTKKPGTSTYIRTNRQPAPAYTGGATPYSASFPSSMITTSHSSKSADGLLSDKMSAIRPADCGSLRARDTDRTPSAHLVTWYHAVERENDRWLRPMPWFSVVSETFDIQNGRSSLPLPTTTRTHSHSHHLEELEALVRRTLACTSLSTKGPEATASHPPIGNADTKRSGKTADGDGCEHGPCMERDESTRCI